MNFIKRAFITVKRTPIKTLILLILIFLLGTLLSGAISIRQGIYKTEANIRTQIPPITTLFWDVLAAQESDGVIRDFVSNWETPTREMIMEIGSLPYVLDYDFTTSSSLFSQELELAQLPINLELLPAEVDSELIEDLQIRFRDMGAQVEMFSLIGVNNPNTIDNQEGLISISSGRFFTQEELDSGAKVAVVSKEFAAANNLVIGSVIQLDNSVFDNIAIQENAEGFFPLYWHLEEFILGSQSYEFEIKGIFETEADFGYVGREFEVALNNIYRHSQLINQIYIPGKVSEEIANFRSEVMLEFEREFWGFGEAVTVEDLERRQSLFVLNDSRDFGSFSEAASEILPEFWEVRDLSATFNYITNSMDTMLWIANQILWVTAIATILILSLLITLFLKDRKHEIGIYLALGEKKSKIISQILIEILTISTIAMTLSLVSGNIISHLISTTLLEQNILSQQEDSNFLDRETIVELEMFNPGNMTIEEMMAAYDTSLDVQTAVMFFGISIVIIIISTAFPVYYILRLNPKKILM